jgi:hypothetical protein
MSHLLIVAAMALPVGCSTGGGSSGTGGGSSSTGGGSSSTGGGSSSTGGGSSTTGGGSASTAGGSASTGGGSASTGGGSASTGGGGGSAGSDGGVTAGGTCATYFGAGTIHDQGGTYLTSDVTWRASDSPHIVVNAPGIDAFTLTIEPCAVVLLGENADITIEGKGKLIANGTPSSPILFDTADTTTLWGGIHGVPSPMFFPNDTPVIDLSYVTLRRGAFESLGNPNFYEGVLTGEGLDSNHVGTQFPILRVQHVTIEQSPDWGVNLTNGAIFTTDSTDLVISTMGRGPMHLGFSLAGTIPPGTYTGNTSNDVELMRDLNFQSASMTLHNRGVAYRYPRLGDTDDLTIGSATQAATTTVTIEAGTTLRMGTAGLGANYIHIAKYGVLNATGTPASPIIFTSASATPVAGDWGGIVFDDVPAAANQIAYAQISYAGGEYESGGSYCDPANTGSTIGNAYAAVTFDAQPASELITNTTISHSLHTGINRGYQGTPVDFLPSNTFTAIASCKQTYPPDNTGTCPAVVPCP